MKYTKTGFLEVILNLLVVPVFFFTSIFTIIPENITLNVLQAQALLIGLTKCSQIYSNFSNSSTGQLSLITSFLQWIGCFARLFTILQEVDDFTLQLNALVSGLLNTIIMIQFGIYWSA